MTGGSRIHNLSRQNLCQFHATPAHTGICKQDATQWSRAETGKALQFTTQ
jgi:hypothetical protein